MKVALLIRSLSRGGAERQLVKLAKGLHSRGVEVVVITFYGGGEFESELKKAYVPVKSLNKASRWDVGSILVRLVWLLRREKPDVLYGFVVTPNLLASATKLLFPGLRVVWGIRCGRLDLSEYDWLARLVYRLEAMLSSLPDLIIVNSLAGLGHLKARGISERKIVQIPNGIDTAQYHPDFPGRARLRSSWGLDDSHTLVGMVTRADPVKGLELFLDAASTLAASDPLLRFVCIGLSDDAAASLRGRAERLGIGGKFTCEGPRDDLSAAYSALDVHVMCSYSEGFPNVVAEAMACGTPCAVTAAGDAVEIIGELGAHTEPGDTAGLARAIRAVIVRRERDPAALRLAARARIIEAYSLERLTTRTLSALESLLPNDERGHWGSLDRGERCRPARIESRGPSRNSARKDTQGMPSPESWRHE